MKRLVYSLMAFCKSFSFLLQIRIHRSLIGYPGRHWTRLLWYCDAIWPKCGLCWNTRCWQTLSPRPSRGVGGHGRTQWWRTSVHTSYRLFCWGHGWIPCSPYIGARQPLHCICSCLFHLLLSNKLGLAFLASFAASTPCGGGCEMV